MRARDYGGRIVAVVIIAVAVYVAAVAVIDFAGLR